MTRTSHPSSLAIMLALSLATPSVAQADDQAKAVALFDEGLKEMKAKNFDKACKAFAASLTLVPDSGTKGSLARCYTELGKVASAWALWRDLAETAPTPALRADAGARAKKLEPRLAKYSIEVTAPTPGLTVTVNGEAVDASLGVAVPIDPGPLSVSARADGYQTWTRDETATEGATVAIAIPALERVAGGDQTFGGPTPPLLVHDTRGPRRSRQRLGIIVAGTGAVTLVAGSVFGLRARSQYTDAKETCGGSIDDCAPGQLDTARGQVDDARSSGTISTVLFIAGGAAVITGAVVYLTAPKAAESRGLTLAPVVDHQSASAVLSGRF